MNRLSIKQKIILFIILIQGISILSGIMGIERLHAMHGLLMEKQEQIQNENRETAIKPSEDPAEQIYKSAEMETYFFIGLIAVWLMLTQFFLGRLIAKPVKEMTEAMRAIANGHIDTVVPGLGRGDEIGRMAETVQIFKDNAIAKLQLEQEQKERDKHAQIEKKRSMQMLADVFEREVRDVIDAVSHSVEELKTAAESLTRSAHESSHQSTIVAAVSEQSSVTMQHMSKAIESMNNSMRDISGQVSRASESTEKAEELARESGLVVNGLAESAERINQIVALITNIATQTNLLALNATIEAARAGDAGKGFAVVANEVKMLATQTSKATSEIAEQIHAMQDATNKTVSAMDVMIESVTGIKHSASRAASAINMQKDATDNIARNIHEAAIGSRDISQNIITVQQASSTTGQAASSVFDMSNLLSERSAALKSAIDNFLEKVRQS